MGVAAYLFAAVVLVTGCVNAGSQTTRSETTPPSDASTGVSPPPSSERGDVSTALPALWHDENDVPAQRGTGADRTWEVTSWSGTEHCDLQSVLFLRIAWPLGSTYSRTEGLNTTRQYVRDSADKISDELLRGVLDLNAELPDGASYTGYYTDDVQLWLGPDRGDRFVYVVGGGTVERWPRAVESIACE